MAKSVTDDCRTIDELRHDIEAILATIHATKLPITITMNGKPTAVLLDVAAFERMVHTLNLVRLLGPAEEDLLAGRVTPLDEFMSEFCRANKIPGDGRRRGQAGRSGNSRSHSSGQKGRRRKVGS
jgi:prevent-host-death family protein